MRFERSSIFTTAESPLSTREQIEAAGTRVFHNVLFDPAMSDAFSTLPISPIAIRVGGVQVVDEARLLLRACEVISQALMGDWVS